MMCRNGDQIITPHIITPRVCDLIYAKWVVVLGLAVLFGQQSLAGGRGVAWPVHVIDSGLSDGDGDLDAMTTEENFGDDSLGIGVIWYENPKFDPPAAER
ncbi:MAG: hypothetical protein KAT00_13300 [Planctomycetes bacterium]|nr:hypothetical protein [Planctomycetota bacterium]